MQLPKSKPIGWIRYVWLVYLLYIPLDAFLLRSTPQQWGAISLGMLAFLLLYFRAFRVERRQLFWTIASVTLLGVLFIPVVPAACVYFVYAAAFAGRYYDRPGAALSAIGILALIIVTETLLLHL